MNKIIFKAQSELSKKLGISIDNLQFIGMQSMASPDYTYMLLFNILDKNSNLYMSTRAADVFFEHDNTTDTYIPLTQNFFCEAMEY